MSGKMIFTLDQLQENPPKSSPDSAQFKLDLKPCKPYSFCAVYTRYAAIFLASLLQFYPLQKM